MAPRQPPRFVVRTLDDAASQRRTRLLVAFGWALSLILVGLGAWFAAARVRPRSRGIAAPCGN